MSILKKTICLLLTAFIALISTVSAYAQDSQPVSEPSGDEDPAPSESAVTAELSDVYGQVDTSSAPVVSTLLTDEAWSRFSSDLDKILNFTPVEDEVVAAALNRSHTLMSDGSGAGLSANRTDKVRILGDSLSTSGWVYVVDKDAMCFILQDENGKGISGALVTISYLNDKGERITRSVMGTEGNTPGIAVFDEIPDYFTGIVDIQAEGYRAMSILDKTMGAGEHYTMVLSRSLPNELYIRGADLSGKDLVNEETNLFLVKTDTEDLVMKIIITKTGSETLPDSIELVSETRGKTILTLSDSSSYTYDQNTKVYIASKRWAEQSAGLFAEDDIVSVKFGGYEQRLQHLTVKNATLTQGVRDTNMPVTQKPMPGNAADKLGGSGWLNITANIFKVPVTFGIFPDGTGIIMASYDITRLDPNTQYKYSSLFDKSWNPKTLSASEPAFQVFQKSFWENAEKVKGGKQKLDSPDKVKCLSNWSYDFSMSFSIFLRSCYNKDTDDSYGTGGLVFCGSLSGGLTEYFLFTAGPVVIPAYVGFEGSFAINTSMSFSFNMDTPPDGEIDSATWKYASDGDTDITARVDVLVGFSVFGGVGVKGVLGASAVGYANMDIAVLMGKGKGSVFTAEPHSLIDLLYGLRFDYYILFFNGSIKLDSLNKAVRLYDSEDVKSLDAADLPQIEFTDLSLEGCAAEMTPLAAEGSENTDRAYLLGGDSQDLGTGISDVDGWSYPDNQAQFVTTKNHTALFRIVSRGNKTSLVYQHQNTLTGELAKTVFEVPLPEGETRSVAEFVAVANKTDQGDPEYEDLVYIGAILADNNAATDEERIRSTDVAAFVVDLDIYKTTESVIISDPAVKGQEFYSAPKPAGKGRQYSVAYASTHLYEDTDSPEKLMGVIRGNTVNYVSSPDPSDGTARRYVNIGGGQLYSTGAIVEGEPSFWVVDQIGSTDKTLQMKGFESDGHYSADRMHMIQIDISDYPLVNFNYDPIVTNWQYVNGCNYFIADGSVYWMRKVYDQGESTYVWEPEKVINGDGVASADNRYEMILNNDQTAIYIIGVLGDYDVNVEEGTAVRTYNRVQIRTLITESYGGSQRSTLHGPLTFKFAYGESITNFTAAYNRPSIENKGLSLLYSTPIESGSDQPPQVAKLRMWKQEADKGMRITGLTIRDYVVKDNQVYFVAYPSLRNYGYARENDVVYIVTDEEGRTLTLTDGRYDLPSDHVFPGVDLYPGDVRTDTLMIKPHPDWAKNEEHEVRVEIPDSYYYSGDIEEITDTAKLKADNTSLTARNALVGTRHYVSMAITNNTFTGRNVPTIRVELDYGSAPVKRRASDLTFELPAGDMLYMYDAKGESLAQHSYHFDLDMHDIWEDGLKDGLRGAYFSLVDENGVQQSNEVIYLSNPAEPMKYTVLGTKTKEDGGPLAGAVIAIYEAGSDEVLDQAVSREDGTFTFYGLSEGDYKVRELEAPEGYALCKDEIAINAMGDEPVIRIGLCNALVRGSVQVELSDEDNAETMLSGAVFTVYADGKEAGVLREGAKGVYTLEGLTYGTYELRLSSAPEGYTGEGPWTVTIAEDGQTVKIRASCKSVDSKEPDDPDRKPAPETGDQNSLILYQILCTLSLAAALLIILYFRRENVQEDHE